MVLANGWEVWVGTLGCLNFVVAQVVARDLSFERSTYRGFGKRERSNYRIIALVYHIQSVTMGGVTTVVCV
jgi:hypothetical protein